MVFILFGTAKAIKHARQEIKKDGIRNEQIQPVTESSSNPLRTNDPTWWPSNPQQKDAAEYSNYQAPASAAAVGAWSRNDVLQQIEKANQTPPPSPKRKLQLEREIPSAPSSLTLPPRPQEHPSYASPASSSTAQPQPESPLSATTPMPEPTFEQPQPEPQPAGKPQAAIDPQTFRRLNTAPPTAPAPAASTANPGFSALSRNTSKMRHAKITAVTAAAPPDGSFDAVLSAMPAVAKKPSVRRRAPPVQPACPPQPQPANLQSALADTTAKKRNFAKRRAPNVNTSASAALPPSPPVRSPSANANATPAVSSMYAAGTMKKCHTRR